MSDEPTRIREEILEPIMQEAQRRAEEEAAAAEAALLEAFPEPLHDLDPVDGDGEEGATWVHLMCDHDAPVHSLDYARLGELRAVHSAAHAEEEDNGETLVEAVVSAVLESLIASVRADCDSCRDLPRPCPSCGRVEYGLEIGARRAVLVASRMLDR